MHVLCLPSFYPTAHLPNNGGFFRTQFEALARQGVTTGVAYLERLGLRRDMSLPNLAGYRFQPVYSQEGPLRVVRRKGWYLFGGSKLGGLMAIYLTALAVGDYSRRYGRPDILHAHQAQWAGAAACLASRWFGMPYLVTEHSHYLLTGELPRSFRPLVATAYAHAVRVIAVSQILAEAISPFGVDTIQVIPNGVDERFFTLPTATPRHDYFQFISIGRLVTEKRFDILLHSFAQLIRRVPQARLLIIGDGPEYAKLLALRDELSLSVTFTGSQNAVEIRDALQTSDALISCSEVETFGIVLLEAMACGLPVIATRSGGPEDIVTEQVGLLVPPRDVTALADAMQRVCRTRYSREAIRQYVVERFAYPQVATRLLRLYDEVITAPPPPLSLSR